MNQKKHFSRYLEGFTLIELLLVIAIIGILAVALFVAINPAEAQKKARDSKRFADLKVLQILIDQYINDGGVVPATGIGSATGATSASVTDQNNQPACPSGTSTWLGIDTCKYGPIVPLDPNNGVTRSFITDASTTPPTVSSFTAQYRARISGSNYEVNILVESSANVEKITSDGGNDSLQWIEVGSDLSLL